jgi:hypothetical protein
MAALALAIAQKMRLMIGNVVAFPIDENFW